MEGCSVRRVKMFSSCSSYSIRYYISSSS